MRTLSTLLLAPAIISIITLFIAPVEVRAQLQNSPCKCDDVVDLIKLLGRYNAAIDKLQQLERTVSTDAQFDSIPLSDPDTGITNGERLQLGLRDAMNLADPSHSPNEVSACIKSIEELKESFHTAAFKDSGNPVRISLYFYIRRVTEKVYVPMVEEILKRINSMVKCPLDDWFGTIKVEETKEHVSEERQSATDIFNLGGVTTQTDTYTRTGAIHIGHSDLNSSFLVVGKLTRKEVHNSQHDCDSRAGEQFVDLKAFRTERSGVTTKSGFDFQTYVVPDVTEDGRRFQISFQIPTIPISIDVSVSDKGEGGCPGEEYNRPESANGIPSTIGPQDVRLEGPVLQGGPPHRISGSTTIPLVPGFLVPGVKLTHTVRVVYNLYKLKSSVPKPPEGKRRK
ncbi:MAG TPA: hypothetical protein VFZ49_06755 [Pyrinomonadaceae bacterium]